MRNKYGAIRTEYMGRFFASKGECDCFKMLQLMERAQEIENIECQVATPLTAGITHRTDFKVWDKRLQEPVWIEFKGKEEQRWRDIKKLWKFYGPGILRIFKGQGLRISMTEEILPEAKREP